MALGLARLVELVGRVRATPRKTEKVALIADLLRETRGRDAELVALYLTGSGRGRHAAERARDLRAAARLRHVVLGSRPAMEVLIAAELADRVRLGVLVLDGVSVREADPALAAEVDAYCAELLARHGDGKSAEVPGAADARALYKALGLDPTKTRPSNEALARRALKGESLYRINTLVDALNLSSLRYQLPFGLYDLDRIEPPVLLRKGAAGESYEGIRKGPVNVQGRPVLVDARGPFGNPSSDSARTCITLATRRALVTVYAPASFASARLSEVLDGTGAALTRHCGGSVSERRLLP